MLGNKNLETDAGKLAVYLATNPAWRSYMPVTPTGLTDSAANVWNSGFTGIAGTTYTFRPQDNSDIWPVSARAVIIFVGGIWTAENNGYTLSGRKAGGGTNELQCRSWAANVFCSAQGIVQIDASGYFELVVAGANATSCLCRLLGYYL